MIAHTLKGALEAYVLYRDLASETVAWYRRLVSVYCRWAGGDVPLAHFTGESISRLLADKKAQGRSPFTLKSYRGGFVSLLRDIRGNDPIERVRCVRTPPLEPEAWTKEEVERLLAACDDMPEASRWRWKLTIAGGYYSGLDRCDLWRIEHKHIGPDGRLVFRRHKTGSRVVTRFPPDVMAVIDARCPKNLPVFRLGISKEWFRKIFAGIVQRAGLVGTFKKLRKSSGSAVEAEQPGKGHRHLANTRAIFERHYEAQGMTRVESTMPPPVRIEW